MTKTEFKKALKLAIVEGMRHEKIRNIDVDINTIHDAVININVLYGTYGRDNIEFGLQRDRKDTFYHVASVEGKCMTHHIRDIDKELKDI